MATSFEGLGTGYLGSERSRFKSGEPSLGAGLLGIGLQQAGIIDNLNEMGNPQDYLKKKILGAFAPDKGKEINDGTKGYQPSHNLWEAPPEVSAAAQPPTPVAPGIAPSAAPEKTIDQHVDDVIPKFSPVSQNTLTPRDTSQDQAILAMASQPAPPPNAPVGQQQGGGGGQIMQAVLPQLAKLIFA